MIELHNLLSNRLAEYALAWSRQVKRTLVLLLDVALCVLSLFLAFYLRLGEFPRLLGNPFSLEFSPVLLAASVSVFLAIPIFVKLGLYRAIFRYSGLPAMTALVRAILLYGVLFASVITFYGVGGVPRTVGLIQPLLLLVLVGASRTAARIWLGSLYQNLIKKSTLPQVLIYGAGIAGRQLASAMVNSRDMKVVGFLDDDDRLHGHLLNGLPIHNPADLEELLAEFAVTDVLLALPSISRQRRNDILAALSSYKLAVRTLPGLDDIAMGKVSLSDISELDIDDLLGREPVKPNVSLMNLNTHNKTVLVTGAGGSIGSELCRQILKTSPKKLLLLDMSEFALYQIHQELKPLLSGLRTDQFDDLIIIPLLASVCDEVRMNEIISTWKPDTLYHAAAYKHVPMVEHNPSEGVRNNVLGTLVCAETAARNGVQNFVLISTDKAVRPTNIMGATKRLAEMVLQALAELIPAVTAEVGRVSPSQICFSIVRFGNVLGSSGSVLPLFREQIKNGGPITLTHPDITRYFMTIPEAAQLVIQAGAMASGGEVFVLDMGQPVRVYDLASRIVELSGLTVKNQHNLRGDIEIIITGLRPGEKLYEELLIGDNPTHTQHARIMKAHEPSLPWEYLQGKLKTLELAVTANDVPILRALLQQLVPGYQPSGEVVDWVHLELAREATTNRAV